jgi:phospholipid/cholesterol/gamma-HCH transport system permease protein
MCAPVAAADLRIAARSSMPPDPAPRSQRLAQLRETRGPDGSPRVEITGNWSLRGLEPVLGELSARLRACAASAEWDLEAVEALDHAGAMLLWQAWGRRRAGRLKLRREHETLFAHIAPVRAEPSPAAAIDWLKPVSFLGVRVWRSVDHVVAAITLLGQVTLDAVTLARQPGLIPWREISASIYRTGAQAMGITALVGFLIGVVLSYLTAKQLRTFGADIFIINLLGVSIIRELGPVLAAILVAGRSGSAMTAQLGVMRVTEELDALSVMGIPHTLRLVLPKMVALTVSLPLIILWTEAMALIGGMFSAQIELGIGYRQFVTTLPEVVPIANLWLGLGKGLVFGMLIALIACHFGLRIEPNTESLGIGTTNSVVTSITIVILVDAVFAIMFSEVGSFQ